VPDRPWRAQGWRGFVAARWRPWLDDAGPLAALTEGAEVVRERPGGRTWRATVDGTTLFVKLIAPDVRAAGFWGWRRTLRWGIRRSTVRRAARKARRMAARGLAVPAIALFAHRGRFWRREELIVTEAVEGRSLGTRLGQGDRDWRRRVLRRAGEAIARLHEAGVQHGHLNTGHIYLTQELEHVMFIDNDENRIFPVRLPWPMRRKNLQQLLHRVKRTRRLNELRDLLHGYGEAAGWGPAQARRCQADLWREVRKRRAKTRM
jgi:hypothetical protein